MKTRIILIALVLLLIVGALAFFFMRPKEVTGPAPEPGNPFANAVSEPSSPIVAPTTLRETPLQNGTSVQIPDPTRIPQEEGHTPAQGYVIAGGYDQSFRIIFYPAVPGGKDRFLVAINREPLSASRSEAEASLRAYTGLTNPALCQLVDIQVWVNKDVNVQYAGRDIGLSFCEGAERLP